MIDLTTHYHYDHHSLLYHCNIMITCVQKDLAIPMTQEVIKNNMNNNTNKCVFERAGSSQRR